MASLRASDLEAAHLLTVGAVCNKSVWEEVSRCEANIQFLDCEQNNGSESKTARMMQRDRFGSALREFIDRYRSSAGEGIERRDALSLCVIHEDVVFRSGFLEKLLQAANEIRQRGIRDFGLSGYSLFDLAEDETLKRGVHYVTYPKSIRLEPQCLLMTWRAANDLHASLRKAIRADEKMSGEDHSGVLRDYPLYATVNSLVQHIGQPRIFAAEAIVHRAFTDPGREPRRTACLPCAAREPSLA